MSTTWKFNIEATVVNIRGDYSDPLRQKDTLLHHLRRKDSSNLGFKFHHPLTLPSLQTVQGSDVPEDQAPFLKEGDKVILNLIYTQGNKWGPQCVSGYKIMS